MSEEQAIGDADRPERTSAAPWSSAAWAAGGQLSRQVIQLLTALVLARFLTPGDFGLVAIAAVVTSLALLLRDAGTAAAIIRSTRDDDAFLSTIFWFNTAFGALLTLAIAAAASLVGALFADARIGDILVALSPLIFLSALPIVHQSLLERSLAFRRLAYIEIGAATIGAAAAIAAAVAGWGVWALVVQPLVTSSLSTALLFAASPWRVRLRLRFEELLQLRRFSLNLVGFNLLNFATRNVDYLVIGFFLGPVALGYYSMAYRLMMYPLQSVTAAATRVTLPVYARLQHDRAAFHSVYLQFASAIAFVTFPMMLGLLVVADLAIDLVLGHTWSTVAVLLIVLAPLGMIQSVGATVGGIYQATGRTAEYFRWGMISSSVAIASFFAGLPWGVVGVATSYAIASGVLLVYPNFAIPFKFVGLRFPALLNSIWRPLAAAALMAVGVLALRLLLGSALAPIHMLGVAVLAGTSLYLGATAAFNRGAITAVATTVRQQLSPVRRGE